MLETLTHNAVVEHRFPDAAYYLHLLATERLGFACRAGPPSAAQLREYEASRRTAEQYYAYASVQKYTDEPFTALTPDTVSSPHPNPSPNPNPDPDPDPGPNPEQVSAYIGLLEVFPNFVFIPERISQGEKG